MTGRSRSIRRCSSSWSCSARRSARAEPSGRQSADGYDVDRQQPAHQDPHRDDARWDADPGHHQAAPMTRQAVIAVGVRIGSIAWRGGRPAPRGRWRPGSRPSGRPRSATARVARGSRPPRPGARRRARRSRRTRSSGRSPRRSPAAARGSDRRRGACLKYDHHRAKTRSRPPSATARSDRETPARVDRDLDRR